MKNNEHAERLLEMAKEEQRSLDQAGDSGGWIIGFTEVYRERMEALRAGAAALREANRWRPIAEGLPEDNLNVLVWDGERACKAFRRHGSWLGDGLYLSRKITHWRPLPDPPEGA